jgi:hypothetical protein
MEGSGVQGSVGRTDKEKRRRQQTDIRERPTTKNTKPKPSAQRTSRHATHRTELSLLCQQCVRGSRRTARVWVCVQVAFGWRDTFRMTSESLTFDLLL